MGWLNIAVNINTEVKYKSIVNLRDQLTFYNYKHCGEINILQSRSLKNIQRHVAL